MTTPERTDLERYGEHLYSDCLSVACACGLDSAIERARAERAQTEQLRRALELLLNHADDIATEVGGGWTLVEGVSVDEIARRALANPKEGG